MVITVLDFPEVIIPICSDWKITISCDSDMMQFTLEDKPPGEEGKSVSCALSENECKTVQAAMSLIAEHLKREDY